MALGACVAGPLAPWMRSLGSHVLPEAEPTSLAAWVAREPDLRELSMERVLNEACAAMQRYLRLDGCALVTFDAQEAMASAGAGALGAAVTRVASMLDTERVPGGGVRALDEMELASRPREAMQRAGVRWLLPIGYEHHPIHVIDSSAKRSAAPTSIGQSEPICALFPDSGSIVPRVPRCRINWRDRFASGLRRSQLHCTAARHRRCASPTTRCMSMDSACHSASS